MSERVTDAELAAWREMAHEPDGMWAIDVTENRLRHAIRRLIAEIEALRAEAEDLRVERDYWENGYEGLRASQGW